MSKQIMYVNFESARCREITHVIHDGTTVPVLRCTVSKHNIAGKRFDFWFRLPGDDNVWHGKHMGDNTYAHVERTNKTTI